MRIRRVIASAVAMACLIASIVPLGAELRRDADVNGDHECNVLDMQCVLAGILASEGVEGRVDVNHDGSVDLLDLQQVVAALGQTGERERENTPPPDTAVVKVSTPLLIVKKAETVTSLHIATPSNPSADSRAHAASILLPTETERYLFLLTPNAPPVLS